MPMDENEKHKKLMKLKCATMMKKAKKFSKLNFKLEFFSVHLENPLRFFIFLKIHEKLLKNEISTKLLF